MNKTWSSIAPSTSSDVVHEIDRPLTAGLSEPSWTWRGVIRFPSAPAAPPARSPQPVCLSVPAHPPQRIPERPSESGLPPEHDRPKTRISDVAASRYALGAGGRSRAGGPVRVLSPRSHTISAHQPSRWWALSVGRGGMPEGMCLRSGAATPARAGESDEASRVAPLQRRKKAS